MGADPAGLEADFEEICRLGVARNIAQNLNTIWLMLFSPLAERGCGSCGTVHAAESEESCPGCGGAL